jgi:Spy/CpxP family protein refolding chaperone
MRKPTQSILTGLVLALAMCAAADAQMGRGMRGGYDGGMAPGCITNLSLTPEQSAKISELRNACFKDTAALRSDLFRKDQELDALMLDPAADIEKAKQLQEELSGLQGQLAQKKLQMQFEVRKILTPDQLRQLPPGCGMGMGPCGMGCGMMPGMGMGKGMGMGWGGGRMGMER